MNTDLLIVLLASMRIAIGLAPMVAASRTSQLLGFPASHDNPTARLMGRLFGVRDIGLGVVAIAALFGHVSLPFALLFNASMDAGDALMISIPLVRRQGIDRAAIASLVLAVIGGSAWLGTYLLFAR